MPEEIKLLVFYENQPLPDKQILFRWIETETHLVIDRWDPVEKKWVAAPGAVDISGIGGAAEYFNVPEERALEMMIPAVGENKARELLTEFTL